MDLKQIHYFIALFEDGSVTRAAKRLSIVQPALSMQIAKLEDELHQAALRAQPRTACADRAGRWIVPALSADHARPRAFARSNSCSATRLSRGTSASA